ncbi:zinc finger, CCHC-type containing protein [Tanacetum coccineum]
MHNDTWELTDLPHGCKALGCKWILKRKMKVDGSIDKYKARLVIQGFRQKEGIDFFDTYAPVARISTIILLLALAAIHDLVIHQMDVKTAFLNGDLDEEIYMKQPEGFVMPGHERKVCKLKKSLYGLKQAPKQWHQKFDDVVLSNGFSLNQANKCMYSKFDASGKGVIICLYADDMLIFGTDQDQVNKTKEFLSSNFDMKDLGEAEVILDPTMKFRPNKGTPVSQLEYSRAIGCHMYAMISTRPDIAFVVGKLSRYTSNPSALHWQALGRKVIPMPVGLIIWRITRLRVVGYSFLEEPKPMSTISIRCDSAATLAKAYSQVYNGKSRHLGAAPLVAGSKGRQPLAGSKGQEPRVPVTCRSRLGLIKTIREQIRSTPQEALFRKTCFGWFLDVDDWTKNCVLKHFMLGRQMKLLGDETDIDDYNNEDDPIPFRRRVFSSAKDGILKFVLLGLEDRRGVPDWILRLANDRDGWDKYPWGSYVWSTLYSQLRDANVRRWPSLYANEPRRDVDKKTYSIFGFTWAFKGRLPTERLTPDENEARSDWWVLSRAYFDGRISEAEEYLVMAMDQKLKKKAEREEMDEKMRKFMQDMSVGPMRQANKGPIIGGPSSFPTQGNNSFFEGAQATPSYGHNMATPNWQTPMLSHPSTSNWQTQMPLRSATPNWQTLIPSHTHDNILNRARREARPSMYRQTSYMDLPPPTVLPKKHGDKTKNKGKNSNVSPLNLGNAFAHDNVGEDDVMIMALGDVMITLLLMITR